MQWTLEQVKAHPLWRGLTDKERHFFELLDRLQLDDDGAALSAFDLRPQSVQVRLNQIRAKQDTGFLYRAMMGMALPSREEIAAAAWQLANSTKDESRKLAALKLVAEMQKPARKDPEGKPTEGDEEPAAGDLDLSKFSE